MKHLFISFFIGLNIIDSNISFFWEVHSSVWLPEQSDDILESSVITFIINIVEDFLTFIIGEFIYVSLVPLCWLITKLLFSLLLELLLEFVFSQRSLLVSDLSS